MSSQIHISVVTPAYKCAECISEMHRRLTEALPKITPDYEIIFVNDGSPQNDWELIQGICERDPKVRGIKLSRYLFYEKPMLSATRPLEKATHLIPGLPRLTRPLFA
jgi:dolichol-phosphate mannosyltransferase